MNGIESSWNMTSISISIHTLRLWRTKGILVCIINNLAEKRARAIHLHWPVKRRECRRQCQSEKQVARNILPTSDSMKGAVSLEVSEFDVYKCWKYHLVSCWFLIFLFFCFIIADKVVDFFVFYNSVQA